MTFWLLFKYNWIRTVPSRLGNAEYRKGSFDKAIELYSHGISFISDSPVLYVNRSVCLIK